MTKLRNGVLQVQINVVFLSLKSPRVAIKSTTVNGILQQAVLIAGLSSDENSAKSFRPTGTTTAIAKTLILKVSKG